MQIRVGYELIYDCPQPTPMMLMLNIHHTRASDIVIPNHLTTTPSTPITAYRDIFGNWCNSQRCGPKGPLPKILGRREPPAQRAGFMKTYSRGP
jgi:hypothetical protein